MAFEYVSYLEHLKFALTIQIVCEGYFLYNWPLLFQAGFNSVRVNRNGHHETDQPDKNTIEVTIFTTMSMCTCENIMTPDNQFRIKALWYRLPRSFLSLRPLTHLW